ncbi:DUF4157 domain-containing protein [Streptomyces sp. NPDC085529]|uniref:eCIS core domain-containing protein n=1 Tax=Streptomyces sp. NPDC085529 TaxID=3365729 RepID=UPI0037D7FD03
MADAARHSGALQALLDSLDHDDAGRLAPDVRAPMEASFGVSLGDVRVHSGPSSAASADRMGAEAYTVGRHVVFGSGRFDPYSTHGRAVLAHELAHVVQQSPSAGPGVAGTGGGEAEAAQAGALASAGLPALVAAHGPVAVSCFSLAGRTVDPNAVWDKVKEKTAEKVREVVTRAIGQQEGKALEVTSLVDVVVGLPYTATESADLLIDATVSDPETKKKIRQAVAKVDKGGKAMREAVKDLASKGPKEKDPNFPDKPAQSVFIDPVTGAPALSPAVGYLGRKAVEKLDKSVFRGVPEEKALLFTEQEIGQLESAGVIGLILSLTGAEELQMVLRIVGLLGSAKGILDIVNRDPQHFTSKPEFWGAIAMAVLSVLHLHNSSAGHRIVRVLLATGMLAAATMPIALRFQEHWLNEHGPDRDAILKEDLKELAKPALNTVRELIHGAILKQAAPPARAGNVTPAPAEGPPAPPPPPPPPPAPSPPPPPAPSPSGPARKATPLTPSKTAPRPPDHKGPPALPDRASDRPRAQRPTAPTPAPAPVPAHPQPAPAPSRPAKPVRSRTPRGRSRPGRAAGPRKTVLTSAARKAAVKKAATKQLSPQKTATKKLAPTKPAAKKPSTKKLAPRKPAVKRPPTRRPAPLTAAARKGAPGKTAPGRKGPLKTRPGGPGRRKGSPRKVGAPGRRRILEVDEAVAAVAAAKDRLPAAEAAEALARKVWQDAPAGQRQGPYRAWLATKKALTEARRELDRAQRTEVRSRAAALRRSTKRAGERARELWERTQRKGQALRLKIRKGEELHHAIELQVLDRFPGAFTVEELIADSNMRPIPAEVTPKEARMLDRARRKPPEEWSAEMRKKIEMRQPPDASEPMPFLKERPPKGRPSDLHRVAIRREWDAEYAALTADIEAAQKNGKLLEGSREWRTFVRSRIRARRRNIDYLYGQLFADAKAEEALR